MYSHKREYCPYSRGGSGESGRANVVCMSCAKMKIPFFPSLSYSLARYTDRNNIDQFNASLKECKERVMFSRFVVVRVSGACLFLPGSFLRERE